MSAPEPLCRCIGIHPSALSKEENLILENDLFAHICEELKIDFKKYFNKYFYLIKTAADKENEIMEAHYIRHVIRDLLSTDDYLLSGIAYYTNRPEEVIQDIMIGKNTDPSASLLRKIIELHRTARPVLYQQIIQKILLEKYNIAL